MITTRVTFTMLVVFVLIRGTGGTFTLPTRDRALALAVGLVLAVQSFCHYEAIALLPVAIAILVMYLYPLFVGLISHFLGRERMRPVLGIALAIALVGLFFALEAPGDGLNPWRQDIKALAQIPNVICKLSGLMAYCAPGTSSLETIEPYVDHVLNCFGPNRMVWGSDWPVVNLAKGLPEWIAVTRKILGKLSADEASSIAYGTAQIVYKVKIQS